MARIFVFVILGLVLSANPSYAAGKVTLENLLRQMTDLSLLAEFPDPPYVTRQFSSYDRASEAPGKESWFANDDHGFMLYDGVVKEKTLYFKSHDPQGRAFFWALAASGGHPRLIARLDDLDRPSTRSDFAVDAKRLYFALYDRQSDVFVATVASR